MVKTYSNMRYHKNYKITVSINVVRLMKIELADIRNCLVLIHFSNKNSNLLILNYHNTISYNDHNFKI